MFSQELHTYEIASDNLKEPGDHITTSPPVGINLPMDPNKEPALKNVKDLGRSSDWIPSPGTDEAGRGGETQSFTGVNGPLLILIPWTWTMILCYHRRSGDMWRHWPG
jgi:hypothetical protein